MGEERKNREKKQKKERDEKIGDKAASAMVKRKGRRHPSRKERNGGLNKGGSCLPIRGETQNWDRKEDDRVSLGGR